MKQPDLPELYPSFDPPENWRTDEDRRFLNSSRWQTLRKKILERDDYTCRYCFWRSNFNMTVDHANGIGSDHDPANLQLLCTWCMGVKHAGMGAVLQGYVRLYPRKQLSQVQVFEGIRLHRGKGLTDNEIVAALALGEPVPFKMDADYLRKTVGFIVDSGKPTSIGKLTVLRPDGRCLRDDEEAKRSTLPPPRATQKVLP